MATLTDPQIEVFLQLVGTGTDSFVRQAMGGGITAVKAQGGSGAELEVNGSDFRELERQGLIQATTGDGYDLTNEGRLAYEELTNPPDEPPAVGFQPPS